VNVPRRVLAWTVRWRTGRAFLFGLFALALVASALVPANKVAAAENAQPGGVVAWGDNRSTQLGYGFNGTQRAAPGSVRPATDYNIVAIDAGRYYTMALRADGKVLTWGSNFPSGQLGLGSTQDRADPTVVPGITDATLIAAGYSHGVASNGGTVYTWGDNAFGQLGYTANATCGGFPCSRSAQPVPNMGNVKGLGAGLVHTLVILGDGTVQAWGSNGRGQLGAGQVPGGITPVQVKGVGGTGVLGNIVQVTGGEGHSLALDANGNVYAWGMNDHGQLGLGRSDTNPNAEPFQVPGLSNIVAIAAGYRHSMALRNDGTVFAWGFNSTGQLGQGTIGSNTTCACNPTPTAVPGLSGVTAIEAGHEFSLAVRNDGTVHAWGANGTYQLGVTAPETIPSPVQVPGLGKVFAVTGGGAHSAALALPTFCDVSSNTTYGHAITQLAARGIIRGYANACFGPTDTTQRAQMAAFIARAMGWDGENHGNPFSDRNGIDETLWRNVGTLAHYGVAFGYTGSACTQRNTPSPCFGPTDKVTQAQTISFVTRAMVKKGYWVQQPDNPSLYPNLPASSGHRADMATYMHYVEGTLPGTSNASQWANWAQPASRGWFSEALWNALETR
jgi:alpha-tubulin suppressor-like RCC1 family protein